MAASGNGVQAGSAGSERKIPEYSASPHAPTVHTESEQPRGSVATHEPHPAAAIFPLMDDRELTDLAADIKARGLVDPIVLLDGKVLDGRNRLRACELGGVDPRFVAWGGTGDPTTWVISKNLCRRHLTESQRAMVAARVKDLFAGAAKARQREHGGTAPGRLGTLSPNLGQVSAGERDRPDGGGTTPARQESGKAAAKAASALNVSRGSVESAARVLRDAPVLAPLVESGALPVSTAAAAAALPPSAQEALAAQVVAAPTRADAKKVAREAVRARQAAASHSVATAGTSVGLQAAAGRPKSASARQSPRGGSPAEPEELAAAIAVFEATRCLLGEKLAAVAVLDRAVAETLAGDTEREVRGWLGWSPASVG